MSGRPSCDVSSDCTTALGAVKECYKELEGEQNVCECGNGWGFTGEECDQRGPHNTYYTISSTIFLVFMFMAMTKLIIQFFKYVHLRGVVQKAKVRTGKLMPIYLLNFIGLASGIFFEAFTLSALIDPTSITLRTERFFFQDEAQFTAPIVSEGLLAFQFCFFGFSVLATIVVSFSWITVAESVPYFADAFVRKKTLAVVKKFIYGAIGFYLVFGFVCLIRLYFFAFSFVSVLITFLAGVMTIVGWIRFRTTFKSVCESKSGTGKDILSLVGNCSFAYGVVLTTNVVFFVIFAFVAGPIGAELPPGPVNPAIVVGDVIILLTLSISFINVWYLKRVRERISASVDASGTPTVTENGLATIVTSSFNNRNEPSSSNLDPMI